MLGVIGKSIVSPMDVIRQEDVKHRPAAAWATSLLAAALSAVVIPIASQPSMNLDFAGMGIMLAASIATWFAVGGALRLVAKALRIDLYFWRLTEIWGLSYLPNVLCLGLYTLALAAPALWRGSDAGSFAFATLFILCLVWKAIYYFIVVRVVFQVSLAEFLMMSVFMGAVFVTLALLGAQLGIQVPMV